MFIRSLVGLGTLMALTLALHGCSNGGSSGSFTATPTMEPDGTTTVVLESSSDTTLGAFGFTITDLRIFGPDGFESSFSPFGSSVLAVTYEFDGGGNEGHILGQMDLPAGTYSSIDITYENPLVTLPSGQFFANPPTGTIKVPIRSPLVVTGGEASVLQLTVDLPATINLALAGGGAFEPRVFGRCLCEGEFLTIEEFDGEVTGVSNGGAELMVAAQRPDSNGSDASHLTFPVQVSQTTVAIPSDDLPRTLGEGRGALTAVLGEHVEIEAVVGGDGSITATTIESDNVGFNGRNSVQIEGVIVDVHENANGATEWDLFITDVEDDDLNTVPSGLETVPMQFLSGAPRVYFESQKLTAPATELTVGMMVEVEGFLAGVGPNPAPRTRSSNGGTGTSGGGFNFQVAPEREHTEMLMASTVEVRSQFLYGTLTEAPDANGDFHASVFGVENLGSSLGLNDLSVSTTNISAFVDGILPVPVTELRRGSSVVLFGAFNPQSTQPNPLGIDVPVPTHPQVEEFDRFASRYLFVKGQEFEGEIVTDIDIENFTFKLAGDGTVLGLERLVTLTVFASKQIRIAVRSTTGSVTGISRTRLFSLLPFASSITLRGYYDRTASSKIFVATGIELVN